MQDNCRVLKSVNTPQKHFQNILVQAMSKSNIEFGFIDFSVLLTLQGENRTDPGEGGKDMGPNVLPTLTHHQGGHINLNLSGHRQL